MDWSFRWSLDSSLRCRWSFFLSQHNQHLFPVNIPEFRFSRRQFLSDARGGFVIRALHYQLTVLDGDGVVAEALDTNNLLLARSRDWSSRSSRSGWSGRSGRSGSGLDRSGLDGSGRDLAGHDVGVPLDGVGLARALHCTWLRQQLLWLRLWCRSLW